MFTICLSHDGGEFVVGAPDTRFMLGSSSSRVQSTPPYARTTSVFRKPHDTDGKMKMKRKLGEREDQEKDEGVLYIESSSQQSDSTLLLEDLDLDLES